MASLTEKLAAFSASLSFDSLPEDVASQARRCLLDTTGALLAGSRLSLSGKAGRRFAERLDEKGISMVAGSSMKKSPMTAAFVNGMAAHALELDDGTKYATYHPGASIIPAALALGEAERIDGKRLLEAIVAGYETSLRIGTAINPGHYLKGFHPTGTIATFGTTTAAAKILGLTPELAVHSLGIAGSLASGINQYEIDGSVSKHVHPGNAAKNGIMAAMLARDGITGPTEILEGRLGFFHCFADDVQEGIVDADLGEDWHILRIYFKPYCSCRYVHYAIEATQKNLEQHPFTPESIESIVVRTHRNAKQGSDIPDYRSPLHARLSIQYGIASILVRGKAGIREYEEEAIADQEVRRVSDMVRIEVDDEIQKVYPNPRSMIVEIRDKRGVVASTRIDHAKGDAENPMSDEELFEKFRDVTGSVMDGERTEQIMAAAMSIEGRGEISSFAEMLHIR
ncbi:MAG: MmgE/PrpD family protein [Synergistaceae bacterium]|nr:MmgE/PrpD family protein [Synergistota bacterium]NLM72102.1 MmgE/PrpD family protein [Synergistaceae bacterium]